jgi:hypothetical protein
MLSLYLKVYNTNRLNPVIHDKILWDVLISGLNVVLKPSEVNSYYVLEWCQLWIIVDTYSCNPTYGTVCRFIF